MRILYHYTENSACSCDSDWRELGIDRCFLKHISFESDRMHITKKRHYHSDVEIHMIECGHQVYELDGTRVTVKAGELLWIAPEVEHRTVEFAPDTVKYAICFRVARDAHGCGAKIVGTYGVMQISMPLMACVKSIVSECYGRASYYRTAIKSRMLDCVVYCMRMIVSEEARGASQDAMWENDRLAIAKQYIEDNIRRNIAVSEVSAYCYISEKQLARTFRQAEGISVAAYIRQKRCMEIERLLSETDLSLFEISEVMGFRNEYYFNAFCKKYVGLPPGAYRRAILKA